VFFFFTPLFLFSANVFSFSLIAAFFLCKGYFFHVLLLGFLFCDPFNLPSLSPRFSGVRPFLVRCAIPRSGAEVLCDSTQDLSHFFLSPLRSTFSGDHLSTVKPISLGWISFFVHRSKPLPPFLRWRFLFFESWLRCPLLSRNPPWRWINHFPGFAPPFPSFPDSLRAFSDHSLFFSIMMGLPSTIDCGIPCSSARP